MWPFKKKTKTYKYKTLPISMQDGEEAERERKEFCYFIMDGWDIGELYMLCNGKAYYRLKREDGLAAPKDAEDPKDLHKYDCSLFYMNCNTGGDRRELEKTVNDMLRVISEGYEMFNVTKDSRGGVFFILRKRA